MSANRVYKLTFKNQIVIKNKVILTNKTKIELMKNNLYESITFDYDILAS